MYSRLLGYYFARCEEETQEQLQQQQQQEQQQQQKKKQQQQKGKQQQQQKNSNKKGSNNNNNGNGAVQNGSMEVEEEGGDAEEQLPAWQQELRRTKRLYHTLSTKLSVDAFRLARMFCSQLATVGLTDALGNQAVKNLYYISKVLYYADDTNAFDAVTSKQLPPPPVGKQGGGGKGEEVCESPQWPDLMCTYYFL